MTDLKTALEEGTATNTDVATCFFERADHRQNWDEGDKDCWEKWSTWKIGEEDVHWGDLPSWLTNTDDALSLVPDGWLAKLQKFPTGRWVVKLRDLNTPDDKKWDYVITGHESLPIAILLAILEIDGV